MTSANLLSIQRLRAFEASSQGVQRLLAAAERNLADAQLQALSRENRFDVAHKCIFQCAMLGLWAWGHHTPTSQPGHHQTTPQCPPFTMGLATDVVIVLDALRKQRNQNDCEGESVSPAVVTGCIHQAQSLLAQTRQFMQVQFPALLK